MQKIKEKTKKLADLDKMQLVTKEKKTFKEKQNREENLKSTLSG